jgi:hypothetical protein
MRTRSVIRGLKNSQPVRVIVNGVGFVTTVEGMTQMTFTEQRVAAWNALEHIAREKITGFAYTSTFYNDRMERTSVDVQVDLI